MLGHTGLNMIFRHYGKFIRNRARKDGGKFLEGIKEAEACPAPGRTEAACVYESKLISHSDAT